MKTPNQLPKPSPTILKRENVLRFFGLAAAALLVSSAPTSRATSDSWVGGTSALWATSANWFTTPATVPGTGDAATFNAASSFTTIDLGAGVTISNLLFDTASAAAYTIGTGAAGSQTLSLNPFGTVNVNGSVANNQLVNAGLSLSATANPLNSIINGSINSLTLAGGLSAVPPTGTNSLLLVTNVGNVIISGQVTETGAGNLALLKTGTGTLTIRSNSVWSGSAAIGRIPATAAGFPLVAREGTLLFTGLATNTVTGELVIGGVVADGGAGQNAKIVVDGSTLNVSSWFSVGRGNGVGGVSSDLVVTNASKVSAGNFSAGYSGGNLLNRAKGSITLYSNSTFTITGNGNFQLGEDAGSDFTMTLNDTSHLLATGTGAKRLGHPGKGTLNINGNSQVSFGNQITYVGYRFGTGIVNQVSGTVRTVGEVRVGGSDTSGVFTNGAGFYNLTGGNAYLGALNIGRGNNNQNQCSGYVTVSNATMVVTNDVIVGYAGTNNTGVLTINNGGVFNIGPAATKWFHVGYYDYTRGEVIVNNGGTLNLLTNTSIKFTRGNSAIVNTNVFTQNGGTVTFYADAAGTIVGGSGAIDMQYVGAAQAIGVYNLNGGVLTVPSIYSSQSSGARFFNFNGGTLKATATNNTFVNLGAGTTRLNVRDGGATVDSNGKDIGISQQLQHSDDPGDAATDGGLTKIGSGKLTLTGGYTYTGPTVVRAGTLSVDASLVTPSPAGDVTVSNSTLTLSLNNGANSLPAANVTLQGSTVLNLNFGTFSSTPAAAIAATGTATQSGTTTINVTGIGFAGQMIVPLITSSGAMTTNGFALGSLPAGVFAVLTNNTANSLDLLVNAAVNVLTWYGSDAGGTTTLTNWDIATSLNWNAGATNYNQYSGNAYGDIVNFTDFLSSSPQQGTNVYLTSRVVPVVVQVDTSYPYSFDGPGGIDGPTALVFTNTGSLGINTSNSYAGGTIVGGGTVVAGADAAFGTNTGSVTLAGGGLELTSSFSSARPLFVNAAATVNISSGANVQWGGAMTGSGSFTKTGDGTLTATGTNIITGNIWTRSGNLTIDTGGSFTNNNWDDVGMDSGDNASMTLKGTGSFSTANDFNIGDVNNAIGVVNIQDSATLNVFRLYVASGNNAASTAQGTVNQTGGTVTQSSTAVGSISIGGRRDTANDPGAVGVYNISGGSLIAYGGIRVGGNGVGTINQSGTSLIQARQGINLARIVGATGTNNLDGGTLETFNVASSTAVNAIFNFNGGTLKAYTNNTAFFTGLTRANVRDGGALIDTAGFNVTIAQGLMISDIVGDLGTGGLTKTGNGTLALTGTNDYAGTTAVNAGTVTVTPLHVAVGPLSVSGGSGYSILLPGALGACTNSIMTLGTGTNTLSYGLGTNGNPATALQVVVGAFTNNGVLSVNLGGIPSRLTLGALPLVKYGPNSVIGTLNPVIAGPQGTSITLSNGVGSSTLYAVITSLGSGIYWTGTNIDPAKTNLWDLNTTTNWLVAGSPTVYTESVPPGDAVNFTDAGSGLVLLSNTASPANVTISNATVNYTFQGSGRISGVAGVTKLGTGTATMNYANNDYTGATVISNGTFIAGSGSAIGDQSAVTIANVPGVSLVVSNTETVGPLTGGGASGGTVEVQGDLRSAYSGAATFGGTIGGPGRFVVNGTGSLTVTGTVAVGNELWVGGVAAANTPTLNIPAGVTVTSTNWLVLGRDGSTGTVNVNGGTLVHDGGGNLTLGTVGVNPKGILNLNSGTISNLTGETWVSEGNTGGAVGEYNQAGGYAYLGNFHVGHYATSGGGGYGVATLTGGSVDAGHIEVGRGFNNTREGTNILTIGSGVTVNASSYVRVAYAGGANLWGMITNNGGILNVGTNALYIGYWDVCNSDVTLNSGQINLRNNAEIQFGGQNNSGVNTFNQFGGTVTFYSDNGVTVGGTGSLNLCQAGAGLFSYNLDGGTLTVPSVRKAGGTGSGTLNLNGGTLKPTASTATFLQGLTAANVRTGGAIIHTAGYDIHVGQALVNNGVDEDGGLTKIGNGTLYLNGANTYTNVTTVSTGLLGGTGTIAGPVTVNSGAGLTPGTSIGTLTINGDITLNAGSTNVFEVNGTAPANDSVVAGASVTYGGLLKIVPSSTFVNGQTFTLFSGAGATSPSNFSSIEGSPGAGLVFTFTNGVLSVVSTGPSTTPPQLTNSISGSTLSLSWDAAHQGYSLETQTNARSVGLRAATNFWFEVPGSTSMTATNFPVSNDQTNVFFRLRYLFP